MIIVIMVINTITTGKIRSNKAVMIGINVDPLLICIGTIILSSDENQIFNTGELLTLV